jgi:ABC-2 type transport system ATP-binding protein
LYIENIGNIIPYMGVIEISKLSKYFGSLKAVDNISLSIDKGEILGFIGPNGAGKTTTINCILGLLKPTSGEILINGLNTWDNSKDIKNILGYIPTDPYFYPNWKGNDYFNFVESIKGKSKILNELVKDFEFNPNLVIKNLSTGNRQKLSIIIALMNSPKLLVMDEPTRGLDPLLQNMFFKYINRFRDSGTTVFMSSHNLAEVEAVCSKVAIIKEGKLVEVGSVKSLQNVKAHLVKLTLKDPKSLSEEKIIKLGGKIVSINGNVFEIKILGDLNPFLKELSNLEVIDITIGNSSLEELFLEYYK